MLDIGGNTCHEIHDAMKRFCDPFLGFVEKVLDDLNADTKFSSGIKDYLQEVCFLLSLPYLTPPQHTSHCWLMTAQIKFFQWSTLYMFCIILGCQKLKNICTKMN